MPNGVIRLLSVVGAALLTFTGGALAQSPAAGQYQENIHYTTIPDAPAAAGDEVDVIEAFSYMCNHCATFEPYITSWKKRKPEHVAFKRIPVVFGRNTWELYARAYVTAEMMGIADEAHGGLMDKLWKEQTVLRDMDELAKFYSSFGVKPEEFVATSRSFAVDARMRRDQRFLQNAGVRGTPSMIVNGKYLVAGNAAVGNFDVLLDVVDFLIERESAALVAPAAAAAAGAETVED
jgi:protein dithiol oxidoreductase (disulfide-forming)